MTPKTRSLLALALATSSAAALTGCTTAQPHLSADFGYAVRQSVVAQIVDPEARYDLVPAPGTNGARVSLAQERYRTGRVIAPSATASTIGAPVAVIAP